MIPRIPTAKVKAKARAFFGIILLLGQYCPHPSNPCRDDLGRDGLGGDDRTGGDGMIAGNTRPQTKLEAVPWEG
jgi:hypothetical protein